MNIYIYVYINKNVYIYERERERKKCRLYRKLHGNQYSSFQFLFHYPFISFSLNS